MDSTRQAADREAFNKQHVDKVMQESSAAFETAERAFYTAINSASSHPLIIKSKGALDDLCIQLYDDLNELERTLQRHEPGHSSIRTIRELNLRIANGQRRVNNAYKEFRDESTNSAASVDLGDIRQHFRKDATSSRRFGKTASSVRTHASVERIRAECEIERLRIRAAEEQSKLKAEAKRAEAEAQRAKIELEAEEKQAELEARCEESKLATDRQLLEATERLKIINAKSSCSGSVVTQYVEPVAPVNSAETLVRFSPVPSFCESLSGDPVMGKEI